MRPPIHMLASMVRLKHAELRHQFAGLHPAILGLLYALASECQRRDLAQPLVTSLIRTADEQRALYGGELRPSYHLVGCAVDLSLRPWGRDAGWIVTWLSDMWPIPRYDVIRHNVAGDHVHVEVNDRPRLDRWLAEHEGLA